MLTDERGSTKEKYSYDAFGNRYEGNFNRINDYGYNGKRYDLAVGLYNYGFRDYKPQIGRWATIDPIRDGKNWYGYCGNDPVNKIDLWGLAEIVTRPKRDGEVLGINLQHSVVLYDDTSSNFGPYGVKPDNPRPDEKYKTIIDNLDDETMKKAVEKVNEKYKNDPSYQKVNHGYNPVFNNCHGYTFNVMAEYVKEKIKEKVEEIKEKIKEIIIETKEKIKDFFDEKKNNYGK